MPIKVGFHSALVLSLLLSTWAARAEGAASRNSGAIKAQYDGGTSTAWIPGSTEGVGYWVGDREDRATFGDLVEVRCRFFAARTGDVPCDSLVLEARVGTGELPIGLDWLLLGLAFDVDWTRPVSMRKPLLDSHFTRCQPDTMGLYYFQVSVVHADRPETTITEGPIAKARQAIAAYREQGFDDAGRRLRSLVEQQPRSALLRALYAGALWEQGDCPGYGRQAAALARMGCAAGDSVASERASCDRATARRAERERQRSIRR